MWYAVVEDGSGGLRSLCTVVADPLPAGLVALALGAERPDLSSLAWDGRVRSFGPRPPAPPPERQIDMLMDELRGRATVSPALEADLRAAWDSTNTRSRS